MTPFFIYTILHACDCMTKNQSFRGRRNRIWKCRLCQALLFRQNARQNRATVQKSRTKLSILEKRKESFAPAHFTRCISMYSSHCLETLTALLRLHFLQERSSHDGKYVNRVSFLRLLSLASSTSTIFCNKAFLLSTSLPRNVFILSENSSIFPASCSVAEALHKKDEWRKDDVLAIIKRCP